MGTDVKKTRFISIFLFSLTAALLLSACRGPEKAGNPPAGTASSPELQTPAASAPRAESQMPVLRITTERNAAVTSKEEYVPCKVSSENCGESMLFCDREAEIRVRGNSTAEAEKKPYRLRFSRKQSLLGINGNAECKNWCLMADYFDPSMMRTSVWGIRYWRANIIVRITHTPRFISMANIRASTWFVSKRRSIRTG